jgi:DNA polymerase I
MLTVTNGAKQDWGSMPLKEMAVGNAMDCDFTLRIWKQLRKEMKAISVNFVYQNLLKDVVVMLAQMEYVGIKVDESYLDVLDIKLFEQLDLLKEELSSISPLEEVNVNSNNHLQDVLFSDTGFGLLPVSFTKKTNKPSVTDSDLNLILEEVDRALIG